MPHTRKTRMTGKNKQQIYEAYLYIPDTKGLRRGGLTPALAPRMPAITEDV